MPNPTNARKDLEQTEQEMERVRDEMYQVDDHIDAVRGEVSSIRLVGLYLLKRGLAERLSQLNLRRHMVYNCYLQLRHDEQRKTSCRAGANQSPHKDAAQSSN